MSSSIESRVGIGYVSLFIAVFITLASRQSLTFPSAFGVATMFDTQSCGPGASSIISASSNRFNSLFIDLRK